MDSIWALINEILGINLTLAHEHFGVAQRLLTFGGPVNLTQPNDKRPITKFLLKAQ